VLISNFGDWLDDILGLNGRGGLEFGGIAIAQQTVAQIYRLGMTLIQIPADAQGAHQQASRPDFHFEQVAVPGLLLSLAEETGLGVNAADNRADTRQTLQRHRRRALEQTVELQVAKPILGEAFERGVRPH